MLQATWEVIIAATTQGLVNGGRAGVFWSFVWTWILFIPIVLSLAEMSSIAPTSGGQYHWVSEFAPPKYQRFLSYVSGWLSTMSWQASTAGGTFIFATVIQGMAVTYHPSYVPQRWHATLIIIALSCVEGALNLFALEYLPLLQQILAFPHAIGWIVVIGVMAGLAPHADAHQVFLEFASEGWQPIGLSLMVGQITAVYTMILSDSAAHVSEEVEMAGAAVPRAMMWSFTLNTIPAFFVLIAYMFSLPDLDAALSPDTNPSGFPFIYVFQQCSPNGTIVLSVLIMLIFGAGNIASITSTSRQSFAFARDHGLFFNAWLARVNPRTHVPTNSVLFTMAITMLLSLINIGSSVAFNAIISLQLMALMATYTISIGSMFWRRTFSGLPWYEGRWTLGKNGSWLNGVAFVYCSFLIFWIAWPPAANPTPETMNWAVAMFGGVMIISLVGFAFNKKYEGPVVLVKEL